MPGQLASIGLLVALPFLASAAGVAALDRQRGASLSDSALPIALTLLCVLIAGGVVLAIVARRSIALTADKLVVKHSFYTLELDRGSAGSLRVTPLHDRREIGISTKRNGVAAFGFYSGWFAAETGQTCFCAVSALPVYKVSLPNYARCAFLAVSCTAEMAEAIQAWAKP